MQNPITCIKFLFYLHFIVLLINRYKKYGVIYLSANGLIFHNHLHTIEIDLKKRIMLENYFFKNTKTLN